MPECSETGFRLIKRCVKRDPSSGSVIEDKYANEECHIFSGSLKEYEESDKLTQMEYAEPDS